ncbi:hypothetical protein A9Q93_07250 [Nonlabens dokdonensis]|uniref:tRNA_anti-like n=1 Tax=Nonlabens dokdonensis TaxID=328515 RepID=A0A1Z8AX32_9FLAO|nr:hypothetical protein [Nonlabens dokdonensis]OUS14891.1 hypothetical protein A9Q93_07250 [Nonlabens dokdonensis]
MKKIIVFLIVLFIIIAIAGYFYLYQDHRDVSTTDAVNSFKSSNLVEIFQDADQENDKLISDQVILVSGIATRSSSGSVTLDNKIFIELDSKNYKTSNYVINKNQSYTIKGRCLGYDDLLDEVKIDQAVIITDNP